ncbi:hypothetical protein BJ165DRAFT_1591833 [Panaeolus papilionaceus]|nr:hypothetical protein BJ165DRAFT_1591833 [Panaeolus papilionaceus]
MHFIGVLAFGFGLVISGIQNVQGATLWHNQDQDLTIPTTHSDSNSIENAQLILSNLPSPSSPGKSQANPLEGLLKGGGCYREKCWTWCDFAHEMWCYTTQGTTWDGKHVECERDYECEEDWSCAERCRHKDDRDD